MLICRALLKEDYSKKKSQETKARQINGLELDSTKSIARVFKSGREMEEYFADKTSAVFDNHTKDSN